MNKYMAVWRLTFLNGLQYRTAALAGLSTQLFFGFIFIMIFSAFYSSTSAAQPMSWNELVNYIWLQQIFLSFVMLWFRDPALFELITSGNIAYELCRPAHLYPLWYMKLLAQRIASALLRCIPIMLIVFVLPAHYRMTLPPSALQLLVFIIALFTGLLLIVAISMLIYISVFWTLNPVGSILLFAVGGEFFAGLVIPVPLMPAWLREITYFLPFRWTTDFPFRVYSGHIPVLEAWLGIAIQLVWLLLLVTAGYMLMKKALKQIVIQGG
ncbi:MULTISPECIES: ABC transporter permease [unclassified Paenibacillus]|uniref:ABC transporter permease n=1 Tax=unclassified Paenibacillus TaxID=185978 RepID=UPI002F4271CE